MAGADGPRAELAAPVRACLAYAQERRGMFELMFRHELLDGGGREVAPNGPPLREATLSLLRHVTEPLALGDEATGGPEPLVEAVLDAHLGSAAP
ncbi:hypothetical protein ACFY7B_29420 [Streptomyces albidoflavus]